MTIHRIIPATVRCRCTAISGFEIRGGIIAIIGWAEVEMVVVDIFFIALTRPEISWAWVAAWTWNNPVQLSQPQVTANNRSVQSCSAVTDYCHAGNARDLCRRNGVATSLPTKLPDAPNAAKHRRGRPHTCATGQTDLFHVAPGTPCPRRVSVWRGSGR